MILSCLPRWTFAVVSACALASLGSVPAPAQVAFPAPLPGQTAAPAPQQANTDAFPPISGSAPMKPMNTPLSFPSQGASPMGQGFSQAPSAPPAGGGGNQADCMSAFTPLRQEAEKRAEVIKTLGKRKAPASEACKALGAFAQSELKMIKYVETNAQRCGIPAQVAQQMQQGHKGTEQMRAKVCGVAEQQAHAPRGGGAMSLSEALGSSMELPEARPTKRNGGSTFDTLSGNVLAR